MERPDAADEDTRLVAMERPDAADAGSDDEQLAPLAAAQWLAHVTTPAVHVEPAAPVAPPAEEALVVQAPVHVEAAPVAAPGDRVSKKRNKVAKADVEQTAAVTSIGTPYLSLCI